MLDAWFQSHKHRLAKRRQTGMLDTGGHEQLATPSCGRNVYRRLSDGGQPAAQVKSRDGNMK